MKLVDLQVSEFIDMLGSDAPAPGGGSASALAGTMGAALVTMVCDLTIGKKKYADDEAEVVEIKQDMLAVREALLQAIDKDTEAFNEVSAVFDLPKETDEDKAKRREAMQRALKGATQVPYGMMEWMLTGLKVTKRAIGKTNTNAASDLGVAALNLKSAIQGAWLNVLINLAGIKDEAFVAEFKTQGQAMVNEAGQLADEIYQVIEADM